MFIHYDKKTKMVTGYSKFVQEGTTFTEPTIEVKDQTIEFPVGEYKVNLKKKKIDHIGLPAEVEAAKKQVKTNEEALKYLKDTDWMVLRAFEGGEEIPTEVKELRQKARSSIKK